MNAIFLVNLQWMGYIYAVQQEKKKEGKERKERNNGRHFKIACGTEFLAINTFALSRRLLFLRTLDVKQITMHDLMMIMIFIL
jgi:hypothetical protein